jgi:hypothetical protein
MFDNYLYVRQPIWNIPICAAITASIVNAIYRVNDRRPELTPHSETTSR